MRTASDINEIIKHYLTYLDQYKYTCFQSLTMQAAEADRDYARVPDHLKWEDAPLPYPYGREWATWWFRMTARMPEAAAGKPVFLFLNPGIDSLIYVNRTPAGAANINHQEFRLTPAAQPGETFEIHVESYAGHKLPSGGGDDFVSFLGGERVIALYSRGPDQGGHGCYQDDYPIMFSGARLAVRNEPLYELYYDAFVLYNLACQLDEHALRKHRILSGLYNALMKFHFSARPEVQQVQAREARAILKPLLACRNGDTAPAFHCIGLTHLDTIWLWPFAESKRKMARSYANMARFAEEFPDFIFLQSQACHLEQMARDYPDVFAQIQRAYQRGQWEPNGCTWVEMDTNMPGGESLIRQFVIGHQTTRQLLGYQGDAFWSLDTFGHSGALPQIMRGCEVRFIVTARIGATDPKDGGGFPYDVFRWRGIDGAEVDAHLLRGGIHVTPGDLHGNWKQQKDVNGSLLARAGFGDGGGGTTRQDLEMMKRLGDLEGCPKAKWSTISAGLKTMFAETENIPGWCGELDIPYFQGTYTTNAHAKKSNRRLEYQFREVEFLSALTMPGVWDALRARLNRSSQDRSAPYPVDDLRQCWKKLLTTHFHDGITGASIRKVNEEIAEAQAEISSALGRLEEPRRGILDNLLDTSAGKHPWICANNLSWERRSRVAIKGVTGSHTLTRKGEAPCPGQRTQTLDGNEEEVFFVTAPSVGAAVHDLSATSVAPPASPFRYTGKTLTTPYYLIRFDGCGRIVSLVDQADGKEYVQANAALNTLQMAEDAPLICDAWNIDSAHSLKTETIQPSVTPKVVSDGFLFFQLRTDFPFGERSHWMQDLIVYADKRRIDFVTRIDWQEANWWLKAAFPVNVFTSRVKCEIQYGHIERDIHTNREHDRGRFEFCAHKWIALEDGSHGVALLNDCKYGHDVRDSVMRLTLLRAPKSPDAQMDMGRHEFTYSLLPYDGGTGIHEIVREAYDLNVPLHLTAATAQAGGSDAYSIFQLDNPNVILEVVKKSEEDDQVVLRLYEITGGEQRVSLTSALGFQDVWETNMLERNVAAIPFQDNRLDLRFRAFEIKTLKMWLA